jgi:dipicolinate synthase subunit A
MIKSARIAIMGGDERQIYMARAMAQRGWKVCVWGLGTCASRVSPAVEVNSYEEALANADIILLPLPASTDGVHVNCPMEPHAALRFSTLMEVGHAEMILGGKLPSSLFARGAERGIRIIDYYDDEILQLRNAVPTAEGALAIAMQELPVVLDGIYAAVIGYGRIGTVLADKLTALGSHVYLYARKPRDLTRAAQRHLIPMRITEENVQKPLLHIPKNCRVIFNTVPYPLFDEEVLQTLPKACLYIDLASAPGGIDWAAATRLGIQTVWGTALPGRCTPESAGEILAQTVDEILNTEGVTIC